MVMLLESSTVMLVRTPSAAAIGLGSLIAAAFSVIIIFFVVLKIRKLDFKDAVE